MKKNTIPSFRTLWREATDLDPTRIRSHVLDWNNRPEPHKTYPAVDRVKLSRPKRNETAQEDLWTILSRRRSRREFSEESISRADLAALLWACQGVTARQGPYLLRTAPSAGALFPFETYVSVQAVRDLDPCLTHLHVPTFSLEVLEKGNLGRHLAQAALGQEFLSRAAAVVIWTAVLSRGAWKYRDRALRYIGLDLGHVCQNLFLAAEALGLGCCPVAAFFDREMNRILDIDGRGEFTYYLAAIGPLGRS